MMIGYKVARKVLGRPQTLSNKRAKIKLKKNQKKLRRRNHNRPRKKPNKKIKSQK